jgi:hypothetical protein
MKPSMVTDRYWLYAWAPPDRRTITPRVGKWLLFMPDAELDEAWTVIESAVVAGRLGPAAKTRTGSPGIPGDWLKVMCIYTRDAADLADRERVRGQLVALGFRQDLVYKTDEDTLLLADLPQLASAMTWADGKKARHFLVDEHAMCGLDPGHTGWENSNAMSPDPYNQLLCRACLVVIGKGRGRTNLDAAGPAS